MINSCKIYCLINLQMQSSDLQQYLDEKVVNGQKLLKVNTDRIKLSPIHRAIGALVYLDSKGNKIKGTAFLISKSFILTAAHNIYDKQSNKKYTGFKFYLAANGVVEDFYQIQSYKYPLQFQTCPPSKKSMNDYAIMKLKDDSQINYNNFCQLSLACCKCQPPNTSELQLQIYGYPFHSSIPNYTPHDKQQRRIELYQYGLSKTGKTFKFDPLNYKITYRITTFQGQSGCPIISYGNIIGIHVGGLIKEQANVGRLITYDLVNNLKSWSKQLGGHQFNVNQNSVCPHNSNLLFSQTMQTALAFFRQGDKKYQQQNFSAAMDNFIKSLKIRERIKGKRSIQAAEVIAYIGTVYNRQVNYPEALSNLLLALDIYSKQGKKDSVEAAKVINNIGNTYYFQQAYAKSIQYYKQCIRICEKMCPKQNIYPYSLSGAGAASYFIKDYKEATLFFQKSLSVHEQLSMSRQQCSIWLAKCYKQVNQTAKLLDIITKYKLNPASI